jgi:hypothetical protein
MEPGEGELHLGLDSGDPGDAEARCMTSAMVQERGLADAGLAADDEDRALAAADLPQDAVERVALVGSPQ